MGVEVERWLGVDTTLCLAIPCRASDGNELRKLSEKCLGEEKRYKEMSLIKARTHKTVQRIWEVRIPWSTEKQATVEVGSNPQECNLRLPRRQQGQKMERNRGQAQFIRSLPQRNCNCLASDRFAGWSLTACLSSGASELRRVEACCEYQLCFRNRKIREGTLIEGENGSHSFALRMLSVPVMLNFSSFNCTWDVTCRTKLHLNHWKIAFSLRKQIISFSLRALIVAWMGWLVNEAIYMLIAMRGNFLIMYVNEHIGWIFVGQTRTANNMLTSC